MRSKAGMKFDCIFEEPLDFIDIDYTHLNKTIRYEQRPHGEWVSKPKRIQVDETDEERIFETRQEWFCSSCGKSFGFRKPEDTFCKYCGSDNRGTEK